MRLTPHEQDRLAIRTAAQLARERLGRGRRLNHPEATAVLADWVLEAARDGRTVADLMQAGRQVLTRADVMVGIPEMLHQVQIEATFPDGTKLVTLHDPIVGPAPEEDERLIPGEMVGPDGTPEGGDPIEINVGRPVTTLRVENAGDRPIQVGSHYHFAEANPSLSFDREVARGQRLDIPAGTAIRFEPGIAIDVDLVPLAGARVVAGLRGDVGGPLDGAEQEQERGS